jgi:hypothetical protein
MKTAIYKIAGCLMLRLALWIAGAQAYQKDAESIDSIIKAQNQVISGGGSKPRSRGTDSGIFLQKMQH